MTAAQVQQVLDAVKAASPVVWDAALRQVYVGAITELVLGSIGLGVAIGCALALWSDREDLYDLGDLSPIVGLVGVFTLVGALIALTVGGQALANPTWAAIQNIAGLATK